jgi:hypothetical protein
MSEVARAGELPSDMAKKIVEAFAEHVPECWGAVDDDQTMIGFEWHWKDGRKCYLDIHADGHISVYWRHLFQTEKAD